MEKQRYLFQWIVCWLMPFVIIFVSAQAFAQDDKIINVSGFSIQVFPFPQSLAEMPMRISFNGSSGAADASAKIPTPVSGLSSNELQLPDDLNIHISRFCAYLFQYLEVASPASPGFATDIFTAMPDYQTGPDAGPEEDQGVSLKIQADISEKSGALIFVMKI